VSQHISERPTSLTTIVTKLHALRALTADCVRLTALAAPSAPNLHRELGLTRTFAWKVARFLTSMRPVELVEFLLTPEGAAILAEHVQRATGDATRTTQFIDAYAREHASLIALGNPATLAALLRNAEGVDSEPIPRTLLRDAFRANRAVWGVEARTLVRTAIITQEPTNPDTLRLVIVYMLRGLRLLRRCDDCLISRERPTRVDMRAIDVSPTPAASHAPHSEHATSTLPTNYIRDFCAPSDLVIARRISDDRAVTDAVIGLQPGSASRCDITKADVYASVLPKVCTPEFTLAAHSVEVRLPVEQVVIEQYCDESLGLGEAKAEMSSLLDGRPWYEATRAEKLAVPVTLERAQPGEQLAPPDQCEHYADILAQVCAAQQQDLRGLSLCRATVAFPPSPSVFSMIRALP
jgi:hypothetical protein